MDKLVVSKLEVKNNCVRQELYLNCECFSLEHLVRVVVEKFEDCETTICFESNVTPFLVQNSSKNKILCFFQILFSRLITAFKVIAGSKTFAQFDFLFYSETCKEFMNELNKSVKLIDKYKF